MMLYLTGAQTSLVKSGGDSPQNDVNQSLGGYVSSSPVPNGAINEIFDLISSYTLEKKVPETLAFALVNEFEQVAKDVTLSVITDEGNLAEFKVAAVVVDKNTMIMEHIANRYQSPISVQFHDASFYRAGVYVKVITPMIAEEEVIFNPMGVTAIAKKGDLDGTWEAIEEAFEESDTWTSRRISSDTFRIERRDEEVYDSPVTCSYTSSDGARFEYLGKLLTKADNSVIIAEEMQPGDCIGIWLQRRIKKGNQCLSNEEILKNYKDKFNYPTVEKVELLINYDLVDQQP